MFTGDVQATAPSSCKKLLHECLVTESERVAFVGKAGEGDRVYLEQAPCLRSLSVTNGHQSGAGASKIREWQGEDYLERSLLPEEAEALMGWKPNSTAIGINSEGSEYELTATQRHRILGNGIIPAEVTEILEGLIELNWLQSLQNEIDEVQNQINLAAIAQDSISKKSKDYRALQKHINVETRRRAELLGKHSAIATKKGYQLLPCADFSNDQFRYKYQLEEISSD